MFNVSTAVQSVKAFGLTFPNGVGLAAGYDKDGLGWRGLAALGFGHIEVGTVTPLPQPGNPAPRVFRLVEDRGVINRMGFPSHGAEIVAQRLQGKRPAGLIVGVNIGKNKDTPNEQASQDYISLLRTFGSLADYLAVNVSSPNTPMLRMLQNRFALEGLLGDLTKEREILCLQTGKLVPLLVKLSPDIPFSLLGQVLEAIVRSGADGVIISNTSLDRSEVQFPHAQEAGGLSGLPLRERALSLLRFTTRELRGQLPVIASGGIMTVEDAQWRLDAGARLVQLYTGMIYSGPSLVGQVARGIHNPW
jgi:dihydroorotate dehydrogenase